jgi:AcrR family transcriptional regulator
MAYRRTPQVQARIDAQREEVLRATADLLAESGYAGCAVAAVAARAGVATGTVYRHFPSKAELVAELFRQLVSHEVTEVDKASRQPGSPAERIAAVIETFAGRALQSPRRAYALLAEPVDPPIEAERLAFRRAYRDVVAERIAEGVEAGAFPEQDSELTAAALVGAIAEVLVGPLARGGADPDLIPSLTAFALRSLGGNENPSFVG